MKRTSVVVLLTALLLAVPLSVSAGGEDEGAESGEPMEITWLGSVAEKTWWHGQLEEMFNVKIIPNGVSRRDGEGLRIMIASGEMPDTGAVGLLGNNAHEYYEQGILRSAPESMFKENAPAYWKAMTTRYPVILDVWRARDKPDEQLAMGGVSVGNMASVFYYFVRKDFLDNVGIQLPDYEETKRFVNRGVYYYENDAVTIQTVEDMLVALRDGDPDGNGKIDTIPFGAYGGWGSGYSSWVWGPILGAFDLPNPAVDRNHIVDGKLYIPFVSPRWKEFTKLAARWWEMGLLDDEFFTIDRNKSWEKSATGVFGMVVSAWNYVGRVPTRPPDTLMTDDEVAAGKEVIMFVPGGPYGKFSPMYGTSYIRYQPQVFGAQASDAKVAKILAIQDSKFQVGDGTEAGMRNHLAWIPGWGQENVHWRWSGEPYKSPAELVPPEEIPEGVPKSGGFFTNYPNYAPVDSFWLFYAPAHYDFFADHVFSDRVQSQTFATERIDIFGVTKFRDILERKGGTLKTMAVEFFAKAMAGEIDVDAEWDGYVSKYMAAGGDELMVEVEKMPRWEDMFGN